ncbi:DUF5709 domain-containing protein [Streptomyces sp. NPDC048248]|uniref:DUF5709 domain-containing protein n=1 Tax=Streptomyces sp. NPDC048248 TaxID=3365523 RepID=UPI0037184155
MSDEAMGDEVYQPDAQDEQDASQGPDLENALDERDLDETLDEGYSPPEKPYGVNEGVTAGEQRAGQSLDERLAEEQPDVGPGDPAEESVGGEVGEERAGRMVGADEGFPRRNDDVVARDVGIDGGAASAEEAAVHVVEDEERHGE